MGLVDYEPDQARPINRCKFRDLVAEVLQAIVELFEDADKIKNRYGCVEESMDDRLTEEASRDDQLFSQSFTNFHISKRSRKKSSTLLQKARWVIHDGKWFDDFVTELKTLIDGLRDITSDIAASTKQEEMVERGILKIKDLEVLEAISEACKSDHPALSDA